MGLAIAYDHPGFASNQGGFDPADPDHLFRTARLAFDNSYPTGGEPLAPLDLGLSSIDCLIVSRTAGYTFEFVYTTNKLMVLVGDYDNAADGPLVEVANATDLSALTAVHFIVFGKIAR